jgi:RNA polymerase sigma factor (sigma-70 family)
MDASSSHPSAAPENFFSAGRAIVQVGGCNEAMMDDSELLRRHVHGRSETAFAELVRRRTGLVYSAALRQVDGDTLLAQDVSQGVFIDLARKARRLTDRPVLVSWLHTSTRYAALKARRAEERRRLRERTAQAMQEIGRDSARDADWAQVRPLLDEAIGNLPETDREAILLRYFESQPFAAMGERLGIGESSARMRAERALERLRLVLAKMGVTSTAAALGSVLATQAVAAPPAGLAATLATGALAPSAAVGGGAGLFAKLSKFFALNKVQPGAIALASVGAVGFAATGEPAGDTAFFVYSVCFGVGLLFTLVSAALGHAFGGHGDVGHDVGGHGMGHDGGAHGGHAQGHAEAGGGANDMPGFSPLSPTTLASFVTAFGGFGMIFNSIKATRSVWLSAPLSALGALGVAAGVFWLFNLIFQKTQGSSEGRVADLAGESATVITPIAADGVGEIAYVQGGTRYSAPARSEGGVAFANGATVKITRVVGSQFYVSAA